MRHRATVAHFFDQAMNLHLFADLDGSIHHINRGWRAILGYTEPEIAHTSLLDLIHPDDREATLNQMSASAEDKSARYFENRYRHKLGGYRTLAWSTTVSLDRHLIFAVASDMTEHNQARARTVECERRLGTLMDNLPGMAYRRENSPEWPMLFLSDGCSRVTRYKPSELVAKDGPKLYE